MTADSRLSLLGGNVAGNALFRGSLLRLGLFGLQEGVVY